MLAVGRQADDDVREHLPLTKDRTLHRRLAAHEPRLRDDSRLRMLLLSTSFSFRAFLPWPRESSLVGCDTCSCSRSYRRDSQRRPRVSTCGATFSCSTEDFFR